MKWLMLLLLFGCNESKATKPEIVLESNVEGISLGSFSSLIKITVDKAMPFCYYTTGYHDNSTAVSIDCHTYNVIDKIKKDKELK